MKTAEVETKYLGLWEHKAERTGSVSVQVDLTKYVNTLMGMEGSMYTSSVWNQKKIVQRQSEYKQVTIGCISGQVEKL